MKKLARLMMLLAFFACAERVTAQPIAGHRDHSVPVDLEAIERFWPIYETLRADLRPIESDWQALADTHAWRILGRFRFEQARERYALAFAPSRADEYAAAVAAEGYEGRVLKHLHGLIAREADLRAYQARIAAAPRALNLDAAVARASEFLPEGLTDSGPRPRVALAVFEPDGYGDSTVVVDIGYAETMGPRIGGLLAHEFHHAYHSRAIRPYARPEADSADALLLESLFQLQREGVANLIDKRGIPVSAEAPMSPRSAERFAAQVAAAPQELASLDDHLARMLAAPSAERQAIASQIRWKVLTRGGHPLGMAMAMAIRDVLGHDALIATLGSPFDFVRAYQQAASQREGSVLGKRAMAVLDALEARVYGQADPAGSARRIPLTGPGRPGDLAPLPAS